RHATATTGSAGGPISRCQEMGITRSSRGRPTARAAPSPSAPPAGIRTAMAATPCTAWRSRSGRRPDPVQGRPRTGRAGGGPVALGAGEHALQGRIAAVFQNDPVDPAGEPAVDGVVRRAAEPALKAEN